MRVLFLDDSQLRWRQFWDRYGADHRCDWAKTAKEAIELLRGERYDLVSLDHDLDPGAYVGAPEEPTGQAVANFIAGMWIDKAPRRVEIHSFNPVGSARMQARLKDAGIFAPRVTFLGGASVLDEV